MASDNPEHSFETTEETLHTRSAGIKMRPSPSKWPSYTSLLHHCSGQYPSQTSPTRVEKD